MRKTRSILLMSNLLLSSLFLAIPVTYSAETTGQSNDSSKTQLGKTLKKHIKDKKETDDNTHENITVSAMAPAPPGGGGEPGGDGPGSTTPSSNEAIHFGYNAKDSITPETTDLLGEQIDLNTGSLSFAYTDVSLPGNNNIPVAISRQYKSSAYSFWEKGGFGDWGLDIPHVRTKVIIGYRMAGTWGRGQECSGEPDLEVISDSGGTFTSAEYYDGEHLNVPGMVSEQLLYVGGSYPKKTKSNWRVRCAANTLGAGEMYIVQSPNGLTYTFNQKVIATSHVLNNDSGSIGVSTVYLYVSNIKDRFGNSVTYHYGNVQTGPNTYKVLKKISSSDGRIITLNHGLASPHNRLVTSVQANGRNWSYGYSSGGTKKLTSVTRPDNSQWQFDFSALDEYRLLRAECTIPTRGPQIASITHPNGVTGTFTLERTLRGKSNVKKAFDVRKMLHYTKKCHQSMALTSKTLSGAGIPTANWSYDYSENLGFYAEDGSSSSVLRISSPYPSAYINNVDYKRTTVSTPDGSKTMYYHNRDYTSALDGKLIVTEFYDTNSTSLLKRVANHYVEGPIVGGSLTQHVNNKPVNYRALLTKRTIELHQGSSNKKYYKIFSNHNAYGVAEKTYEYNSFNSNKRYTKQGYTHDSINYLLNLPTTTYVSSDNSYSASELVSQQTYHSASGGYKSLPNYRYRFGRWVQRNESYHTSGTNAGLPKLTRLNATNRWSEASNYFRGIPRTIRTPQSTSTSSKYAYRTVDNNGWVKRSTDFKGNITDYSHDNLGRVTLINPASSQWNNTSISYNHAYGGEESAFVYSGMLIKITTNGNFESKVYYDGLHRPALTKVRDKSDSSTTVYSRNTYNAYGKAIFQSQPQSSLSLTYGTLMYYDGLGRVTKSLNNALGGSGVRYSYAPDSKVSVTDNRNLLTTTTYKAYGSPSQQQPISIITPSNLSNTSLTYNLYGNLKSITQGGITEYRVYDSYQNLCKTVRPDVGNTALSIDAVGNTSWMAQGISVSGSTSSCDNSVYASEKTTFSYDNLGAIRTASLGDGAGTKTFIYDKQGNVTSLSFDGVTHTYGYNDRNLPTSEKLTVDGYSWTITNNYNANQALTSHTYPSGNIAYSPNALGQAKSVGNYASSIKYHANGQLSSMNQSNGCVNTQTLKTYGVPDIKKTYCNGTNVVYNRYYYDNNLNITNWDDLQSNTYDLKFSYDALDRLNNIKNRNGSVIGDMNYDSMGNITKFDNNGNIVNYYYDSTKKLSSTSGAVAYSMSYDSRGNVISNGNKSFTYNLANQMTSGNGNTYQYDGHNRRVKAVDSKGTRYSFYTMSGRLVVEKINGVDRENYYLGSQLVAHKQSSTVAYIHSDLLGSTAATTNSSGGVLTRSRYKPFGTEWGAAKNEIGYTGHKHDTDLGLTYMQARYYDPVIGRFYSNDPVGYTAKNPVMSFNRYMYANNNPYKYTDPDGKFILNIIGAVIGGVSTYNAAKKAGLSGKALWSATAVGTGLGALTGGLTGAGASGAIAITGVKVAAQKALNATAGQTALTVAKNIGTGAISGLTGEVTGSIAGDKLPTVKGMGFATGKGMLNGTFGGSVATMAGKEIGAAVTAVSSMISNAMEPEKRSSTSCTVSLDGSENCN